MPELPANSGLAGRRLGVVVVWAAMKTPFACVPVLAASLLVSAPLCAEVSPELLSQLKEIRELLKPADTDTPEMKSLKDRVKNVPSVLQSMIDQGQFSNFPQYSAGYFGESAASIPWPRGQAGRVAPSRSAGDVERNSSGY